jgi:hypothetical protein
MALLSPIRKEDLELLTIWADIIETTYRIYTKKPTPETKAHLDGFIESYETLKNKIDTKDYTREDASYWRFEEFIRKLKLSPPTP